MFSLKNLRAITTIIIIVVVTVAVFFTKYYYDDQIKCSERKGVQHAKRDKNFIPKYRISIGNLKLKTICTN
jgi:hypothetical protein